MHTPAKRGATAQSSALQQKVDLHLLGNTPHGCSSHQAAPSRSPLSSQQLRFAVWPSPLLLHAANPFASPFNQQPPLSMLLKLLSPLPWTPVQDILPGKENAEQLGEKAKDSGRFSACALSAMSILNHAVPMCVYTVKTKHSEWQSRGSEDRPIPRRPSWCPQPGIPSLARMAFFFHSHHKLL